MPRKQVKSVSDAHQDLDEGTVTTIAAGPGEAGNIDKIRDILFGNQVRDFDRRFARVEEELAKTTAELRAELFKRLDALEHFMRQELDTIRDRVKGETEQRTDAEKRMADELQGTAATLAKSIQSCEDKISQRTTELRQQILDQSKTLSNDVLAKYEQATQKIDKTAGQLEKSKIDRTTLAEYMVDIAMRLSDQNETGKSVETVK